jgi:multiple sugar transport system permease protein
VPVGLYAFIGYQTISWGKLSAAATIMLFPVLLFILFYQRHLIRGLTLGSYR